MKHHVDIINGINEIFIKTSRGEVSDEDISKVTNTNGNGRCVSVHKNTIY